MLNHHVVALHAEVFLHHPRHIMLLLTAILQALRVCLRSKVLLQRWDNLNSRQTVSQTLITEDLAQTCLPLFKHP